MDCLFALQSYINVLLLSTPQSANSNLSAPNSLGSSSKGSDAVTSSSSIKILLLDFKTTAILSLSTTQSNLLLHGVYLTDLISNPSRSSAPSAANRSRGTPPSKVERLPHLHCITFLRPTEENIQLLERELDEARYGTYSLFFTGVLKRDWIERLAEADVAESVREVQVRDVHHHSFERLVATLRRGMCELEANEFMHLRNFTPISHPSPLLTSLYRSSRHPHRHQLLPTVQRYRKPRKRIRSLSIPLPKRSRSTQRSSAPLQNRLQRNLIVSPPRLDSKWITGRKWIPRRRYINNIFKASAPFFSPFVNVQRSDTLVARNSVKRSEKISKSSWWTTRSYSHFNRVVGEDRVLGLGMTVRC